MENYKEGKIIVDGIEIKDEEKQVEEVRREVGMVLKNLNIFKNMKIMEKCKIEKMQVRGMRRKEEKEIEMNYM